MRRNFDQWSNDMLEVIGVTIGRFLTSFPNPIGTSLKRGWAEIAANREQFRIDTLNEIFEDNPRLPHTKH